MTRVLRNFFGGLCILAGDFYRGVTSLDFDGPAGGDGFGEFLDYCEHKEQSYSRQY